MQDFEHTGPGTPSGAFMRQFWQPVHRSDDLPIGRAKPIRILGEDLTLFRDHDGVAHVVSLRCPHRGTQLSVGWVEGNAIRCLYHGWKFDGRSGKCVEAPGERDGFHETQHVAAYPTREHIGLIFSYFGEGEPPAFPHIPGFEAEGVIETWAELFPCNFFQCWENSWDEYHVNFAHRTGAIHWEFPAVPQWEFEETSWGLIRRSHVPGKPGRVIPFIMPNILRSVIPCQNGMQSVEPTLRDSYLMKVPIDDENHLMFASQHARITPDNREAYDNAYRAYLEKRATAKPTHEVALDIVAGRITLEDARDHPYLAIVEDQVAQMAQGRIADRSAEHLGRTDAAIAFMRRIWSREVQAISEGRPAKRWEPLKEWTPIIRVPV